MDNPIFKLEGVVHERSAETLQDFEGPLDLIPVSYTHLDVYKRQV